MRLARVLALLIAWAPAVAIAASHREADTRRDLRNAERLNSEQRAARKEAADRAAQDAKRRKCAACPVAVSCPSMSARQKARSPRN